MRGRPRWLLPDEEHQRRSHTLATALGAPLLLAQVLVSRGIFAPAEALAFLNAGPELLHDPLQLKDAGKAAQRIFDAIQRGERILLYGDYDVDGSSSIVILKKTLDAHGAITEYFVPHRIRDGYGMREEVIVEAAARGVRLVVSVDTGIRAAAVVATANTLGVDVIVTDHHLPETELPAAFAILNPNQPGCTYPNRHLCGAGVALRLAEAFLALTDMPAPKRQRFVESLEKMAAMATVADVAPLTGENRALVRRGLAGFRDIRNPGLRALMQVAGFAEGETPRARQVGFQLGPRINAAGRMADASEVVELFLTDDAERAMALAQKLDAFNKERQQTEEGMRNAIFALGDAEVQTTTSALVFSGTGWHRGVAGIVASRVVERYGRPAFVLEEADDVAVGSGRSIPGFHLLDALDGMKELFTRYGGHEQAAGLTIPVSRLPEFRERLQAWAAARLTTEDFRPQSRVDGVIRLQDWNGDNITALLRMAPFGYGNDAPTLMVRGATLTAAPQIVKERHLKLHLLQDGRAVSVIGWNIAHLAEGLSAGVPVDVLLNFDDGGRDGPGFLLRDVRGVS
jgi:single-stranded-DNA-specific exonuclease